MVSNFPRLQLGDEYSESITFCGGTTTTVSVAIAFDGILAKPPVGALNWSRKAKGQKCITCSVHLLQAVTPSQFLGLTTTVLGSNWIPTTCNSSVRAQPMHHLVEAWPFIERKRAPLSNESTGD